ncbi:MAG: hypothetical protein C0456_15000 [Hyphomonas sp.]|uniref:hypothetical protein n=1 Tax=Hyphomonas sp. TaxID=87 RepID=UPI001D5C7F77|nr:hypothetical protein [Hyphomonas sp.]MBA4227928.1 hypothetical protein [Hyphomonas sp.]
MTRPTLLALCLILAACAVPDGTPDTGAAGYTISADGAGGLRAQTPFTVPAMERAFPGLEVITVAEGDMPAFHIREPGSTAPLYIVTPDWTRGYAGAVATRSASVTGPDGIRAGVTRYSELAESWRSDCRAEPDLRDGPITCERPGIRLSFPASRDDPVLAEIVFLPPLP